MKLARSSDLMKEIRSTFVSSGMKGRFIAGAVCVLCFALLPDLGYAATISKPFEISGWIPYWRTATGTADAFAHLDVFTEINPFVYTVKKDGTLADNGKLDRDPWLTFFKTAKEKKVRFIPTVMWSDGAATHATLKDPKKRLALVNQIAQMVKANQYDGVDIDFEAKLAETKPYFSLFLKELYRAMGNKWVMCTIEARTPVEDRFTVVPKDLSFANDFKQLNKYCDRVRIMAYDQQTIDLKLNKEADQKGEVYAPVADPRWVEKAMKLAAKDISKKKLVLGIPTYGYEYDVTAYADGYTNDLLWSFNPGYALPIAAQHGIAPARNAAGEIWFSYNVPAQGTTPSSQPKSASLAAETALAEAKANNTSRTFRVMWWSDAEAIRQKVELAKKLGLRGVAVFKIDGGEDPMMWEYLK